MALAMKVRGICQEVPVAKILEFMEHMDEWIEERYDLIRERMDGLVTEDMSSFFCGEYLNGMAHFLHDALRVYDLQAAQVLETLPLEEQEGIHHQLYGAPVWQKYGTLSDACWSAGEEWGPLLWAAGREWERAAAYACRGQRFLLTIAVELFLQVYQSFEMESFGELHEEELRESIRQAMYSHYSDYCDVFAALVYHEQFYPGEFHRQLLEAGMEEWGGLYRLGGRVDEAAKACNERLLEMDASAMARRKEYVEHVVSSLTQVAKDQNQADSESSVEKMKKNRIALYVSVGFEPLAQMLYDGLTEAGFCVVCLRKQETLMARISEICKAANLPELPLFWDRGLKDRRLTEEKNALDAYKELCQQRLTVLVLEKDESKRAESDPEEMMDGGSAICLTLSQKQEHLYTEFLHEIRLLRTDVWPEQE